MAIAIVVLTHNKAELLRECVDNVLSRTSSLTREIIIWNNASFDGTREYLDTLEDPRMRIVHHEKNIGQNAYSLAFRMTDSDYMIEVDDDIVDAPAEWDKTLVDAFEKLPQIGYLAANLVNDPNDTAARSIYQVNGDAYHWEEINGVLLKVGPVGGGCSLTSREIHDRVGGFPQSKRVFYYEDEAYIGRIQRIGYTAAYLEDLRVHHKGGPYYATYYAPEKAAFYRAQHKKRQRKNMVKRLLLALPLLPRLNQRFQWFEPPRASERPSV